MKKFCLAALWMTGAAGCTWFVDLEGLTGYEENAVVDDGDASEPIREDARAPFAPPASDASDGSVTRTVLDETWSDAAPSSGWYGTLRERGKSTAAGWCIDVETDAAKWSAALAHDALLTGARITTRLEYRYEVAAEVAVSKGMSGVEIGIQPIAAIRSWSASTHAIAGSQMGRFTVDSEGLHGTVAPAPRSALSAPLRMELEATAQGLRGRLYSIEDGAFVLRQALDVMPAPENYDLSQGARPRIAVANFFGAQRVCITRVQILVDDV